MLLDDDVVADGEAKAGPFSGRLGREEGAEHLVPNLRRNTRSVVPNFDFHSVAKALG